MIRLHSSSLSPCWFYVLYHLLSAICTHHLWAARTTGHSTIAVLFQHVFSLRTQARRIPISYSLNIVILEEAKTGQNSTWDNTASQTQLKLLQRTPIYTNKDEKWEKLYTIIWGTPHCYLQKNFRYVTKHQRWGAGTISSRCNSSLL